MKKKYFFKFFLFTVFATLVTFTACKDYDDDIDDLQNQITNLSSVKTDLDGVKADIASALAKANEALTKAEAAGDAEAIKAAKDAADKAQKAADELLPRIEELEAAINAMDSVSQEDLDALVVEIDGLREQFAEITGSGLLNFVLIPDYVFKDGATGIALFNQLDAGECGMISAPTTLRYRVSPTSASEEMIDVEGIRFEFNAPITRAEEAPKFTAEFVSLKDGVLTVKAHMATDALKGLKTEDDPTVGGDVVQPQIQLIVAAASGEEVITDWVSVQTESIGENLFLANGQFKSIDDFEWTDDHKFFTDLEQLMSDTDKEADHVVQIKYDKPFDLVNVANTLFDDYKALELEDYGLSYKFDLKDGEEDIKYISDDNPTDQQDFIELTDEDKGTVNSSVYGTSQSRTAIGRTPIVRVQLMNDDCVVETAYIKINWTEDDPIVEAALEVELEETLDFNCEELYVESTVKWMNEEIYKALDMTKEEFHEAYTLSEDVYDADGEIDADLGSVEEVTDTDSGQTTYLFGWTYTLTNPEDNVVTGYIHYMDGDRVAVRVKVTLTVDLPEFSLYGYNTTYWKENMNLFTVNPIVYDSPGAESEVNIYADLLRGFLDEDGVYTSTPASILKPSNPDIGPGMVDFVFDENELENYTYFIGDTEYSVAEENLTLSSDKKQLFLGANVAATIGDDPANGHKIYLDTDGTENTDEAKALIGHRVPVKITNDQCGEGEFVTTIKSYEVLFVDPIKINAELEGNFRDAVESGSRVSVTKALTFTDWKGTLVSGNEPGEDATAEEILAYALYGYYLIEDAVWDTDDATSNLELIGGNRVPTEGFTEGPVTELGYRLEHDDATNELVFYNDEGVLLAEPFIIYVPVTVSHKWGSATRTVAITVTPTGV